MGKKWAGLIKNFELFVLILVATIVTILGMLERVNPQLVNEVTLALLGLIAFSLIRHRTNEENLQKTLDHLLAEQESPSLNQVLLPYQKWMEEIEAGLESSKEVWILSRTCYRLWVDYYDEFKDLRLQRKGKLRFMMVDPENGAVKMIVKSGEGFDISSNVELRQRDLRELLDVLKSIQLEENNSKLQVATIDYLPAWTLIILDPKSLYGQAFVELATFRANGRNRPTFLVSAERDPELFDIFIREYETMWNAAKPAYEASKRRRWFNWLGAN